MYEPERECERIIERIGNMCRLKGVSCYSLAKKAEMSTSSVYSILQGKTKPNIYTLYKLCNALDISVQELLEETEQGFTVEETGLIRFYRTLSAEGKRLFGMSANMIAEYENKTASESALYDEENGNAGFCSQEWKKCSLSMRKRKEI